MAVHYKALASLLAVSMLFSSASAALEPVRTVRDPVPLLAADAPEQPSADEQRPTTAVTVAGDGKEETVVTQSPDAGNTQNPSEQPGTGEGNDSQTPENAVKPGNGEQEGEDKDKPADEPEEKEPEEKRAAKPRDAEELTGKIEVTLRLDYEQSAEVLQKRKVTATLTAKGGEEIGSVELGEAGASPKGEFKLVRRSAETGVDMIDMTFDGLEQGTYTLKFTGDGYKNFETDLTLKDYSLDVTVGTGDVSFTMGDVTDDHLVNTLDLLEIIGKNGHMDVGGLDVDTYDFDGDGKVDVTDLAYINHCVSGTLSAGTGEKQYDGAAVFETSLLAPVDMKPVGGTVKEGADGFMQFSNPNGDIQFSAAADESSGVEVSCIQLVTSTANGSIRNGVATVEYVEDGKTKTEEIAFTDGIPEGVLPLSRSGDDRKTITIDLGKRVAVKKITITVTKTDGGEYASVAAIEFLADIVPENPVPKYVQVHSLTAEPANESVTLKWSSLPNITGYEVLYYLSDEAGAREEAEPMQTSNTTETIGGLSNNKPYTFEVTPIAVNEKGRVTWRGTMRQIGATPEASQPPAKINMVTVTARDAQLDVSWKAGKNASTYEVYYSTSKDAPQASDTLAASGLTTTSASITGLTNNTTYYVYVKGRNDKGLGPASNVVSATPKAVEYAKPEGIPADEAMVPRSKIKSIRLLAPGNIAAGTTYNPEYMIDNNYQTSWTAKNWWGNEHVEVEFTEPVNLSAAIWVPRLDGDFTKYLSRYCVRVWTDEAHGGLSDALIVPDPRSGGVDRYGLGNDSDMHTWPTVKGSPAQSHFAIMPFGPIEGVTKIQVAAEQAGYNLVSLAELMFLEYDMETDVPTLIENLFEDVTFTKLKPGVTEDDIAKIEALLAEHRDYYLYPEAHEDELALARTLLGGGTSDGALLDGLHTTYGTQSYGQGGSTLQPLGVTADAGTTVAVYADIPAGTSVTLYATQVNAEANAWRTEIGQLNPGRNVLKIQKIGSPVTGGGSGGSLYYSCGSQNADQVRLHIRKATDIPVLDVQDWYTMSEAERDTAIDSYLAELSGYISAQNLSGAAASNTKNVTEISTPSVLLSIPATAVSGASREQLRNSILAWEDVFYICKTTQGIPAVREDSTKMTARQNIRCMQMFEGAFMYAAGNHIGIGEGSCKGMAGGSPIPSGGLSSGSNGLFGWGIAHEIGHNMDKIGRAEITNNIYSLMVQTYDGNSNILESRLEKSGKYAKIFSKTARQYPGMSNDVFVQLGMYWQLHLAYDGADEPLDFYNRFFASWKAGNAFGPASTTDEKVAVIASKTAGRNLTAFFEHWGMTLSDAVKAEIGSLPAENRAIWYLNDQSRRDRLANPSAPAVTGSAAVSATVQNEKDVVLTITPSNMSGDVQGYEIRRNNIPIDFVIAENKTSPASYTDHIGSANHTTYTYSVAAYDRQGNQIGAEASAPEVRIAYDATVDTSKYTVTRDGDKATVTFTQTTQVSGLKLTGANVPTTGAYTVTATVKAGEGDAEQAVTARSSTFDQSLETDAGCFLTYFNKPGTGSADTRIWTYDVTKLEITGIPADFPTEQIQIVSYAGDEVSFYPGAEAGILKTAYGDIPAGSIVVVGKYRGDPVYNVPKVQGEFTKTWTDETGEVQTESTKRDLDGDMYLFAEIPEDKEVSDISDGLFVFVLNVEKEKDLQTEITETDMTDSANKVSVSHCDGVNLLPSRMRIIMARTNTPDTMTDEDRVTATTLWIDTPGGSDLPYIELKGETAP